MRPKDTDLHPHADQRDESLALLARQHLRVTHRADDPAARQDQDRRGNDGASERRHADLVHADDADVPAVPQLLLKVERWHEYELRA